MNKLIYACALCSVIGCGCTKPQSNEISDMTLECFKANKAITIQFIPHPMDKDPVDKEIEKK